ncbi:MAG TPA: RagB/SusD family nutrient uptake outer membrane protein [Chryseolinea sp.]|nr:RagB/SusD family nutrient uptake outer membrane protein [Chryseolinea sp.]
MKILSTISTCVLLLVIVSCEEFVTIDPPVTQITRSAVFSSDANALSAVAGLYSQMMDNGTRFTSGESSITVLTGLSADELDDQTGGSEYSQFHLNQLTPVNSRVYSLWSDLYTTIYAANSIIEGLQSSTGVSVSMNRQLMGEAKFIRAFCHFYLANTFGNIPLVTTTVYDVNSRVSRSSTDEVYASVVADLKDSQQLLADVAIQSKSRVSKWASTALLARVYLYAQDWANAEVESARILDAGTFLLEPELVGTFSVDSREAIWQLQPVVPGYNTFDGNVFILTEVPTLVSLRDGLLNYFEDADKRRAVWINSFSSNDITYYFPYKYQVKIGDEITENLMVLRLSEQYLIRAEARAMQGNTASAVADLNIIRQRAGLDDVPETIGETACLDAIVHERLCELFCEWGHRWYDLKRTQRADAVLSYKPSWSGSAVLYPIPQIEIQNNTNLLPQNAGY